MNRLCRFACVVALFVFTAAAGFAADGKQPSQYSLGDQTMTVSAGLFVPLFLLPTGTWLLAGSPSQLTLGGFGSLNWSSYVAPQLRLGVELGGTFSWDINSNALLMLPVLAKASYIFTAYPFEIPLTVAVGMNVVKLSDQSTIDLLLRPGASFYWIYNSSWSFGLNADYWFDIQFDPVNGRQASFLAVSLTALYHY